MTSSITSCKVFFVVLLGYVITCQAAVVTREASPEWSYDDPKSWPTDTKACGGEHQSPVNIDSKKAVQDPEMPPITFVNYDKIFPQIITNNGHTVMLQLQKNNESDDFPCIKKGGLDDTYIFKQLHFHWGDDDSHGSEHRIDNQQYAGEMHMVHYNSKYAAFEEAMKHPDGLAVLAVLIEIEKRGNVAFRHIEHFEQIMHPEGKPVSKLTEPIRLDDLFPDNTNSFYRYQGSLTTPGCNEDVTWTIFDTPIALSQRQLDMFRKLFDMEGKPLIKNFRPPQSLNDRFVLYRPDSQR